MDRRDFIRQMGSGLAASWICGKFSWQLSALAVGPELRLALIADAHLKNSDNRRPEARALARAVAEIKAMIPSPDLVLFAGDLAHKGRPDALDLGREILSELSTPLWAVRGEGDIGRAGTAPWVRRFGKLRFSRLYGGIQFIGLDTALGRNSQGQAFELGADQKTWLAQELAGLDSGTPLVIVSHAPLARLFLPWQQWTGDAPEIAPLLSRFHRVLYIHGHVHGAMVRQTGTRDREIEGVAGNGWGEVFSTTNHKPQIVTYLSLPATAWPCPQAIQGTPAVVRPGVGPRGCGWVFGTLRQGNPALRPLLWQA